MNEERRELLLAILNEAIEYLKHGQNLALDNPCNKNDSELLTDLIIHTDGTIFDLERMKQEVERKP